MGSAVHARQQVGFYTIPYAYDSVKKVYSTHDIDVYSTHKKRLAHSIWSVASTLFSQLNRSHTASHARQPTFFFYTEPYRIGYGHGYGNGVGKGAW